MRKVAWAGVAALALAVLLPPLSASTDVLCSGSCTAAASLAGDTPLVVANNSTVQWTSLDVSHLQVEMQQPLGSSATCFSVAVPGGGTSGGVLFHIEGSVLDATVGSTTLPCTNALPLAGQGFAVPYLCRLHPWMRGVLVVSP